MNQSLKLQPGQQMLSKAPGESLHHEQNKSVIQRFIQAFQMQNAEKLLILFPA